MGPANLCQGEPPRDVTSTRRASGRASRRCSRVSRPWRRSASGHEQAGEAAETPRHGSLRPEATRPKLSVPLLIARPLASRLPNSPRKGWGHGLRFRGDRAAGRATAGLGFVAAIAAAYFGGHLVYRKRIGVDHAPHPEWDDFIAVLPESALVESTPRRVDVRGVPVVLVRRGDRIHALADTCAHLGGPLSEGQVDERGIRCPWQGSRFALDNGRILEGPSTFAQPCFEVRVRNAQIELRAGACR